MDCALVTITAYGLSSVTERQEKRGEKKKGAVIKLSAAKPNVLHNKFIMDGKKKEGLVRASNYFMFSLTDSSKKAIKKKKSKPAYLAYLRCNISHLFCLLHTVPALRENMQGRAIKNLHT